MKRELRVWFYLMKKFTQRHFLWMVALKIISKVALVYWFFE